MARVALLTMSDGRDYVARDLVAFCRAAEDAIAEELQRHGHQVIRADEPVSSNQAASAQARQVAAEHPDLTVFHYPVWAFPHFSMLAADQTTGPLLLLGNIDPAYPGMVGMLAAGGGLDQIGRTHVRAWGNIADPDVQARVLGYVAAGQAVSRLRGSTFGRIGGRPMGMYTAVADADQWIKTFGSTSRKSTSGRSSAGPGWSARHGPARGPTGWNGSRPASITTARGSPASCSSGRSAATTRCASSSTNGTSTSPASWRSPR